jgi:hypothetical protein
LPAAVSTLRHGVFRKGTQQSYALARGDGNRLILLAREFAAGGDLHSRSVAVT